MFERHHQDLPDDKKERLILNLLSPEVSEELETFLLIKKPSANYHEVRKALLRLFAKRETIQDPVMSLVYRTQHEHENLFQYMRALKRLSREAFEKETLARDELIKDRFVRGIKDERIKIKLCERYYLPLDEIMELAGEWEDKLKKTDIVMYKPQINRLETVKSGGKDSGRIRIFKKPEDPISLILNQPPLQLCQNAHSKFLDNTSNNNQMHAGDNRKADGSLSSSVLYVGDLSGSEEDHSQPNQKDCHSDPNEEGILALSTKSFLPNKLFHVKQFKCSIIYEQVLSSLLAVPFYLMEHLNGSEKDGALKSNSSKREEAENNNSQDRINRSLPLLKCTFSSIKFEDSDRISCFQKAENSKCPNVFEMISLKPIHGALRLSTK